MIIQIRNSFRRWLRSAFYSFYEILLRKGRAGRETNQYFPVCHGKNYFYEPLINSNEDRVFFSKYYQDGTQNPLAIEFSKYRSETLAGKLIPAGTPYRHALKSPSAIPFSVSLRGREKVDVLGNYTVEIDFNGETYSLRNLVGDRFYYLPVKQAGVVGFNCSHDLVIGDPLVFGQEKRNKKKLVVLLDIDSVPMEIFSYMDREKDLPNITKFFSAGMQFNNCHAMSDWTRPSVPTIVSGRHVLRHGLFAPLDQTPIGQGYPVLSEQFQKHGYLTFLSTPFWGTAPAHGYTKGFDRMLYKRHLSLEDTLNAAYENIRAFPERDQYLQLGIVEFHNHVNFVPDISAQVDLPLDGHDYLYQRRGPLRSEDASQRARAIEELKRIDFYLGHFFRFVEDRFSDDEYLIVLFADHGVRYLRDTPHLLTTDLTHVPFYLKGGGINAGVSDEFVETCDIAPTILELAGLPPLEDIDGRLPETFGGQQAKTEIISESYYPGRQYNATFKDNEYELFITSEGLVDSTGQFEMGTPEITLYRFGDYSCDIALENEKIVVRLYEVLENRLDQVKRRGSGGMSGKM